MTQGIALSPDNPTALDVYGPVLMTIGGFWHGASVVLERRLPERTGDPIGGSWGALTRPAMPVARGFTATRPQDVGMVAEFRAPFVADETRLVWLVDGPHRARVIAGDKRPVLEMILADPSPDQLPAPVVPRQPD